MRSDRLSSARCCISRCREPAGHAPGAAGRRAERVGFLYFDNVGGETSDRVLRRLALRARVVICGQISQYNNTEVALGPRLLGVLIVSRARIEGFLVSDYAPRFDEAIPRLARWLAEGKIRYREDVTEGIENAPRALMGMLSGENRGKTLVKVR